MSLLDPMHCASISFIYFLLTVDAILPPLEQISRDDTYQAQCCSRLVNDAEYWRMQLMPVMGMVRCCGRVY